MFAHTVPERGSRIHVTRPCVPSNLLSRRPVTADRPTQCHLYRPSRPVSTLVVPLPELGPGLLLLPRSTGDISSLRVDHSPLCACFRPSGPSRPNSTLPLSPDGWTTRTPIHTHVHLRSPVLPNLGTVPVETRRHCSQDQHPSVTTTPWPRRQKSPTDSE